MELPGQFGGRWGTAVDTRILTVVYCNPIFPGFRVPGVMQDFFHLQCSMLGTEAVFNILHLCCYPALRIGMPNSTRSHVSYCQY